MMSELVKSISNNVNITNELNTVIDNSINSYKKLEDHDVYKVELY